MATIACMTGTIRAQGSGMLQFSGPANVKVDWTITSGGGALYPQSDNTDAYGLAYCRLEPGGYVGAIVVRCSYGA